MEFSIGFKNFNLLMKPLASNGHYKSFYYYKNDSDEASKLYLQSDESSNKAIYGFRWAYYNFTNNENGFLNVFLMLLINEINMTTTYTTWWRYSIAAIVFSLPFGTFQPIERRYLGELGWLNEVLIFACRDFI